MKSRILIAAAGVAAALFSGLAPAKVAPEQAARLGKDLTPVGAEKGANADGSIPAWSGGYTQAPPCYKGAGARYCDPFPDDKTLFTIGKANLEQYKARLTPGQVALFAKYPDTYKMNVYATRRTFANPQFVYDATAKNAVSAALGGNGEALEGAITGIPFPIPADGMEAIWNHKVRFRDTGAQRWNNQFAVTVGGDYNLVKIREDAYFVYNTPGIKPADLNNKILYFLQLTTEPPRLAGTLLLVHETMDQVKEPRGAWQYNPGQRRLRRAPNVAYDNPGTASDGLRTNDQLDMFNGAMDRYDWKLVGKKEVFVPANAYRIHSEKLKYKDIIKKGHLAQDLARYELRRVWVVDSNLKKGTNHLYKRRTFYVDEDSWQIVAVDVYDARDQLWRVQEGHSVIAYDKPYQLPALETVYDLQSGRYLVMAMNNEDTETATKTFDAEYFNPANVAKQATK
ncbi:MAG: DUF1329 domain-containing protein [Gammaproteobacteria bacterium]|nr:DUF1329 domain-containing protein [Gammaproteobacteria bacterium]